MSPTTTYQDSTNGCDGAVSRAQSPTHHHLRPHRTLSPLLRSFQKGWMKSQEPSLPVASSVTRMAFFSSSAGNRLFTVRYLLLFMCRSWGWAGREEGAPGPAEH